MYRPRHDPLAQAHADLSASIQEELRLKAQNEELRAQLSKSEKECGVLRVQNENQAKSIESYQRMLAKDKPDPLSKWIEASRQARKNYDNDFQDAMRPVVVRFGPVGPVGSIGPLWVNGKKYDVKSADIGTGDYFAPKTTDAKPTGLDSARAQFEHHFGNPGSAK